MSWRKESYRQYKKPSMPKRYTKKASKIANAVVSLANMARKRKRKNKFVTTLIRNPDSSLPDRMITKHKFVTQFTLNPGLGATAWYGFRANGIYDPDYSGAGHQPLYRDEFAVLYSEYAVISSRIKVTAFPGNAGVSTSTAFVCILRTDKTSGLPTGPTHLLECADMHYTVMGNSAAKSHSVVRHRHSYKDIGLKDYTEGTNLVAVGANPVEDAEYFWVGMAPITGSYDVDATAMVAEIEYTVAWSSPEIPLQS